MKNTSKYQNEWDNGYHDGIEGITQRADEIGRNLENVSMPDLYYFRGNIVGRLRYAKQIISRGNYTIPASNTVEAFRADDI